jgi:hypothetical protein
MADDTARAQKLADPYNFVPADEFFPSLDIPTSGVKRPTAVINFTHEPGKDGRGGLYLHFDDSTCLLVQYIQPKLWKLHRPQSVDAQTDKSHS